MIGDRELSDIVEKSSGPNSVDLVFTETKNIADTDGVDLGSPDVAGTNLVSCIDRCGKRLNGRKVDPARLSNEPRFLFEPLNVDPE